MDGGVLGARGVETQSQMGSDTTDWLRKVATAKVSFQDEVDEVDEEVTGGGMRPQLVRPKYNSADLRGLRVAHDPQAFQTGASEVLVLRDMSVLQDEDGADELVSLNLAEEERVKRHREQRRHVGGYSGLRAYEEEDTEDAVITMGPRRTKVLAKYDHVDAFTDEPTSQREEGFVIGQQSVAKREERAVVAEETKHADTVALAGVDSINITDLLRQKRSLSALETEKKRARRLARSLFADEPEIMVETMPLIESTPVRESRQDEEDELELQRVIAASRREHLQAAPMEIVEDARPLTLVGKSLDALLGDSLFRAAEPELEPEREREREMVDSGFTAEPVAESTTESIAEFIAEPLVRSGVAATLALLNMRGVNLTARGAEKTVSPGSNIKLEYFDSAGNQLSTKEAYKELSRKFHGKKAGKARVEKTARQREEAQRLEAASASVAPSAIMTNLRQQQESTGTPFVVLSGVRDQETLVPVTVEEKPIRPRRIFGLQVNK